MKTSKRILTAILSSALSAVMLFGSTTTAMAVENDMVTVSSPNNTVSADSGVIDDELKSKLATMDDDDLIFVVYKFNPLIFGENVKDIVEFAKTLSFLEQPYYHEESQTYYVTPRMRREYEQYLADTIYGNGKNIRDEIAKKHCSSMVWYNFHGFEMHVNATKADIESFLSLKSDKGNMYAESVSLGNVMYYDKEHNVTWDDFSMMINSYTDYMAERYKSKIDKDAYCFYATFDTVEGKCLFTASSFKFYAKIIPERYMHKYIFAKTDNGCNFLFYEDGEMKHPAEMYEEGKISRDDFYKFGAMLGDVNYDKQVDVNDVTYMQLHLAGYVGTHKENGMTFTYPLIDKNDSFQEYVADISYQFIVDVQDVTMLQMMLAGYELEIEMGDHNSTYY